MAASDIPSNPPPRDVLLKLVLLPALIVLALVILVVVVRWWTWSPTTAETLVTRLETEGSGRWRAAAELATLLRGGQDAAILRDEQLAARLAQVLTTQAQRQPLSEDGEAMQVYLCHALAEFHLPRPPQALLDVASGRAPANSAETRRAAILALALLSTHVDSEDDGQRFQALAVPVVLDGAMANDSAVRSAAAYAIGVLGGDLVGHSLEPLLTDADEDVRYNAATALARHGDPRCLPVLLEMLSRDTPSAETSRSAPALRDANRDLLIARNALEAVRRLAAAKTLTESQRLQLLEQLSRLAESDRPRPIRQAAAECLEALR